MAAKKKTSSKKVATKPKGKYYTEIKVSQSPDQLLNTLLNTSKPVAKGKNKA